MSQNNVFTGLKADHPLELPDEDSLHRADFCEALADTLANRKGGDSLAVGITGKWGTGKSTIKNFVKHFLRKKNPKTVVIEFNPWEWSGQGKLLEAFLWSLSEALGKPDASVRNARLGKRLKRYSALLQAGGEITSVWAKVISTASVAGLGLGVWTGFGAEWLSAFLGSALFVVIALPSVFEKLTSFIDAHLDASRKSINDLRKEIGEDLIKIKSPIIVFIDDVDRLSKEEIKLLFQLVRANLRFKNLTFILLFQRDIVASALDELTTGNGSDYIGKIIQVEFDVPKASTKDMQALLLKTLDQVIFGSEKKPFFDEDRWRDLFHDHLWHYFRSLRDIKRFSSSFEFYYRRHLNQGVLEVDAVDLIAVEVLRVFDNEAYNKLSRALFSARRSMLDLYGDNEERSKQFNLKLEEITAHLEEVNKQKHLKSLLLALFPQAVEYSPSGDAATEWHRRSRICDEKSFHRYFELIIDTSQATQLDLDTILSNAYDRGKVVELLKAAIENGTIDGLLTLILYGREDILLDSMPTLITALFDVGDELPEGDIGWYSTSCSTLCNMIIYHRLKHEDKEKVNSILLRAHSDTTGFYLPIDHLSWEDEDRRSGNPQVPNEFLIREEALTKFYEINLKKIALKANNMTLLDHKKCSYVLYRWAKWNKGNEAKDWVAEVVKKPSQALKLLMNFLGESRTESGSKVTYELILGAKSIDSLVEIEVLLKSASKVPEHERSEKSANALELLKTAVERKEAGRNYETIRPQGSRFY